jgi:lactoylglutathione lyase
LALAHTCVRVLDPDRSLAFYRALGFEQRGKLVLSENAYNLYLGLPGDGDRLELTVNVGETTPYDLGNGYGHIAVTVPDLDAALAGLAEHGIAPERPPYTVGTGTTRICFVQDPDGYRVELIGGDFPTPQDD